MTDGGKASDKRKFTTNTSNNLFCLSSIKGKRTAGKKKKTQTKETKTMFQKLAGFCYFFKQVFGLVSKNAF